MTTARELIGWLDSVPPDTPVYVVRGDNDDLYDVGAREIVVHDADCCAIECGGKYCGLCKLGYRVTKAVML